MAKPQSPTPPTQTNGHHHHNQDSDSDTQPPSEIELKLESSESIDADTDTVTLPLSALTLNGKSSRSNLKTDLKPTLPSDNDNNDNNDNNDKTDKTEKVKLISFDGVVLYVERKAIERSVVIRNKLLDDSANEPIAVSVEGDVLIKVIEFCGYHANDPLPRARSKDSDSDSDHYNSNLDKKHTKRPPSRSRSDLDDQVDSNKFNLNLNVSPPIVNPKTKLRENKHDNKHVYDDSDSDDWDRAYKPKTLVISEWDREFIKVDNSLLFGIIIAAHALQVYDLVDVGCKTVSDKFKGKTPEQLRGEFNVADDLTQEDKERITKEYEWAMGS